jgi:2-desacetyl-2-hydroxyethyl bacteriochlorophyllide A dehydrogenase
MIQTQTMKAAIYTGIRKIEIREVESRHPPAGHLVLETKQVGICGSDLHNYYGDWEPSSTYAMGHETCGVVTEIGEGVTGFELGDTVAVECFSHCGQCIYCRKGHYNHCLKRRWVSDQAHGGFAEYTTVHASALFKLPAGMSFEQGALVEPLAVANRAVAQTHAGHRDRVAIIGGGSIGLVCLAAAKAAGVKETVITVKYPQQARLARQLGADHVIDIGKMDVEGYLKELTDGIGVDVVIETVGGGRNFDTALAAVRKRGTVVLVAGYSRPLEVDLRQIVSSEATVTGSNCYAYSGMETDFEAAIDLITSERVDLTGLVTHRFSLMSIAEAFEIAADKGSGAVKVHLQP